MSKKISILILIAVMILATVNFAFWSSQKEGFHCDEIYSHGLSNKDFHYNIYDEDKNIRWNEEKDIDNYMTASENARFDYVNVYENQRDDVHPPLFYIIMHTVSSFMPDAYSVYVVIIPNILFTLATAVFLYLTVMMLTKKREFSLLAVVCFLFSVNCINIVTYMRMYAMLTFFTTAVTYLSLKYIENEADKKFSLLLGCFIFLGAYTQYYFLIFMFALAVCTVVSIRKDKNKLINYLTVIGCTALSYVLVWPFIFRHLFSSGRGNQAFSSAVSLSFFDNFIKYIEILFSGTGIIVSVLFVLLVIICFALMKKNEEKHKKIWIISIVAIFYFIVISKIAPFQTDRYIAPIVPLIFALFAYMIYFVCTKIKKASFYLFSVIAVAVIIGLTGNILNSLYSEEASYNNLNYLYRVSDERKKHWEQNHDKKCVMIHTDEWQFLRNLPDYKQYSKTAFVHADDISQLEYDTELINEKEFILYMHRGLDKEQVIAEFKEFFEYKNFELLITADERNQADIYRVY